MEITRDKYKIVISDQVVSLIDKHAQVKKQMHEAGGILLGQIEDNTVYIIRATMPNKFDFRSRFNFVRAKDPAQIVIDYEFYYSNKRTIYLGEWHTHPEANPKPSVQDITMIKDQFHKNKINEKFLLLIIKGLPNYYIALYEGKQLIEK